jgi:dTDP-4-amino-4,6-dideoxygalactose transaminase
MKKNIFVTQPQMPPLEEFIPYLEKIWANKILTNSGPMHNELELELTRLFDVGYVSLFNNCTTALIVALRALNLTGEVITSPFTFAATAHSLLWNKLTPVFVDINRSDLNLDVNKIEKAITKKTSAIFPIHCYGNPCLVDQIDEIAKKYELKVIYDAAHAFGIKKEGKSILKYGDMSVLSFHATKVFNTFEGGAIISKDKSTKEYVDAIRNFGIKDETNIPHLGLNGKMSEVHAAFGLLQLKKVDALIDSRKEVCKLYRKYLDGIPGISYVNSVLDYESNGAYFPIIVEDNYPLNRDQLYLKLKSKKIFARRYFYPLLSNTEIYTPYPSSSTLNLGVANELAEKVICLPIYPELLHEEVIYIVNLIREV